MDVDSPRRGVLRKEGLLRVVALAAAVLPEPRRSRPAQLRGVLQDAPPHGHVHAVAPHDPPQGSFDPKHGVFHGF